MNGHAADRETNELLRDALCEFVNIGSGKAVSALSNLLGGERVDLSVTTCVETPAWSDLLPLEGAGVTVEFEVAGPFPCRLWMLLAEGPVLGLLDRISVQHEDLGRLSAEGESALREVSNIMTCALLDGLSAMVGGPLTPSVPRLRCGDLEGLAAGLPSECLGTQVLTNKFCGLNGALEGRIVVLADCTAVRCVADRLGVGVGAWGGGG